MHIKTALTSLTQKSTKPASSITQKSTVSRITPTLSSFPTLLNSHTHHSTAQQQETHNAGRNQLTHRSTAQPTARPTTQTLLWRHAFPALDVATPEGAWAQRMVELGTPSLTPQAATYHRMMIITGVARPDDVSPGEVLRYLLRSTATCKGQTLDQYLGHILQWGTRIRLPWTGDPMWTLLRRGLRLTSTPRVHAQPITVPAFHNLLQILSPQLALAATITFLTGSRVDEVFRHTQKMYHIIPQTDLSQTIINETAHIRGLRFVVISTGKESKCGPQDPEDLRFLDVMALNDEQIRQLHTCLNAVRNDEPVHAHRSTLTSALNRHGYSDHSFKAGTAELLSELIRDDKIPEEIIPMFLKHKSTTDPIQSVTSGYLNIKGRANLLQRKQVFKAAFLVWSKIFRPHS